MMALPHHDDKNNIDRRPPADPASWCLWEGAEQSVQDARICTRGQARANYCQETCADFTTVKVWKRDARALTLREQYQNHLDLWSEYDQLFPAGSVSPPPAEPPSDWSPQEDAPCWEFCQAGDEGAAPVWVVTSDESVKPPPTTAEWRARKDGDDGR